MANPDWLRNSLSILKEGDWNQHQIPFPKGVRAKRLGRNKVWRIEHENSPDDQYFVKIGLDAGDFAREYTGLTIAQALASEHSWIYSPQIVDVQADAGLIVTMGVSGTPLALMLRMSLRMDHNPFRERHRIDAIHNGFRMLGKWMTLFHSCSWPSEDKLLDHGPAPTARRVERLLARISFGGARWRRLAALVSDILHSPPPVPSDMPCGILHGDLSLGNILILQNSICVLDFEDMGYGPTFFDSFWLTYMLKRSSLRRIYFGVDRLLEMIDSGPPQSLASFYNLWFEIMRLDLLDQQLKNGFSPKNVFLQIDKFTTLRALDRLCGDLSPRAQKG